MLSRDNWQRNSIKLWSIRIVKKQDLTYFPINGKIAALKRLVRSSPLSVTGAHGQAE
jgi:hypothetical protein